MENARWSPAAPAASGAPLPWPWPKRGGEVSICARRGDEVAATVEAAGLAFGQACDVSKPDQLRGWITASARHLGGIDIVVANASALASGASPEAFAQAFEVDLMHTVNAATMALPWLQNSAAGAIVAIASISGVEDYGYDEAAYGAMKAQHCCSTSRPCRANWRPGASAPMW